MRLAEEKAEKAEKTCEEQEKMDKSKLALVMQKMKTAEQQRDGYKKQVQWFRGNAPHIEMPMEIANLPEGESTFPSGSVASMMTGVSARVDTAAASRKTEEQERLVIRCWMRSKFNFFWRRNFSLSLCGRCLSVGTEKYGHMTNENR